MHIIEKPDEFDSLSCVQLGKGGGDQSRVVLDGVSRSGSLRVLLCYETTECIRSKCGEQER
jgi:hypothetical protein